MKASTRKRLLEKAAGCHRIAVKCRSGGDTKRAAAAYRKQGRLLKLCGEVGLAAEAYRKATDLNPADAFAQCGLGQVLTADVLIYLGDLDAVFKGVKSCSQGGGAFVFSVEEKGGTGYTLQSSARYAHSRRYVHNRIQKHGMRLTGRSQIRIRKEKDRWAFGRLYEVTL
jgi:predicted TPR repeat methyltransferase